MHRSFNLFLGIVAVSALAIPNFAAEWKCGETAGCSAVNPQGGTVTLAKGSVVETGAGWVVNRANGWAPA